MALLSVLLVMLALGQAPVGNPQVDADLTALARLEADWNTAHVRGDAAVLGQLFADDLVVMVPGMDVITKAIAIGMSGKMKFDRYETLETTFRVYGDTAIATGRLQRSRVIGGAKADDDWRFTKVYLRRGGRWQVVSFHASNTRP